MEALTFDKYLCPVCGFALSEPPWEDDTPSDEICPSCGIHFGYDDAVAGHSERQLIYLTWRRQWLERGMHWFSLGRKPPSGWNPQHQLQALDIPV